MKFPDHSDLTTVTIEDVGEFRVTMDRIGAVDPRDHWYEEYVDATAELAPLRAQYAAQLNLTIEAKGEIDTLRADLTIADTTAANLHDEIRKRDEAIATLRADVAATIDRWAEALSEIATLRAALDAGTALLGYMDYGRMRVGGDEANRAYLAAWRAARAALATAKETP